MDSKRDSPDATSQASANAARVRQGLDSALATRDRAGAVALTLGAIDDGSLSVPDLYTLVLGPLLADTGIAWQRGTTRVWEEHYATATVRTIVEALAPRVLDAAAKAVRREETVLLACPPEEYHDLGLRMAFDRFLIAGYDAHFLGADMPVSEISDAAEALGADLVGLSASTHYHRVRLRETVDRLRARLPESIRIAVGGPAFAHGRCAFDELVIDAEALGLPGAAPEKDG